MTLRRGNALAAVWGLAEATLFFIVPDVIITLIAARHGLRAGWIAAAWAALGAVLGGTVMYLWANLDAATVEHVLDFVPAVSAGQIIRVKTETSADWLVALLVGAFSGDPYKLYAAASGELRVPLLTFLSASFGARIVRFLLAGSLARATALGMQQIGLERWQVPAWAIFWIAFYAWYFLHMPW